MSANNPRFNAAAGIPPLLSIPQASYVLGTGRSTTFLLIKLGYLRPLKIGRKTLFASEQVQALREKILAEGGISLKR